MTQIRTNLENIEQRIAEACKRSGRARNEVDLLLVTKYVQIDLVQAAFDLGFRLFGENRVQELKSKIEQLPDGIEWHLIGSLQTNKVKDVVGQVSLIESCDRLHLSEVINKEALKQGLKVPVLLQVNTSREASKGGFAPDEAEEALKAMEQLEGLDIKGLMTIGPLTDDKDAVRGSFRELRELRDQLSARFPGLGLKTLSMGMSQDFEIAIEEGATLIRLGSIVFGQRPKDIKTK